MLELHDLSKQFGVDAAVRGVTLAVPKGTFLALLGPSGAGKTTLLRLIAGLEAPDGGRIVIDGQDMNGVPARARAAGFVFQSYALFRHMTVADNIAFGLNIRPRRHRPRRAEIAARVASLLDLIRLPGYGGRYPDQLSGGQRQRVALARALAIQPRVLLLDEPFGALDAGVRKELRLWLRTVHDATDCTTVMVTHDQTEAMDLADTVAVLREGHLEQLGAPDALWQAPANPFVYAFLGEALRFEAIVAHGAATVTGLPIPPLPTDLPDGPAIVMARPHHITLNPDPQGAVRVHRTSLRGALLEIDADVCGRPLTVRQPPGGTAPVQGGRYGVTLSGATVYGNIG